MFFTHQKPTYPTAWRTRFAFLPVQVGEIEDRKVYTWLARYETRWVDEDDVERRVPAHAKVQLPSTKVMPLFRA